MNQWEIRNQIWRKKSIYISLFHNTVLPDSRAKLASIQQPPGVHLLRWRKPHVQGDHGLWGVRLIMRVYSVASAGRREFRYTSKNS